ncbi:MAG: hypothetical protein WC868_02705 [Bacteroidales bacterium]
MKKIAMIILSIITITTYAQKETKSVKNYFGNIKLYPVKAITGLHQIGYEQKISSRLGISISFGYRQSHKYWTWVEKITEEGFKIEAQGRYYFHSLHRNKDAFSNGLYIGQFLNYKESEGIEELSYYGWGFGPSYFEFNSFHYQAISGGAILGITLPIYKRLNVDLYSGIGYRMPINEDNQNSVCFSYKYKGFAPKLGFTLGFSL